MITAMSIVVSILAIGIALWALRQTARLNRELDEMEAAAARMLHDLTQRELEEVGQ